MFVSLFSSLVACLLPWLSTSSRLVACTPLPVCMSSPVSSSAHQPAASKAQFFGHSKCLAYYSTDEKALWCFLLAFCFLVFLTFTNWIASMLRLHILSSQPACPQSYISTERPPPASPQPIYPASPCKKLLSTSHQSPSSAWPSLVITLLGIAEHCRQLTQTSPPWFLCHLWNV